MFYNFSNSEYVSNYTDIAYSAEMYDTATFELYNPSVIKCKNTKKSFGCS